MFCVVFMLFFVVIVFEKIKDVFVMFWIKVFVVIVGFIVVVIVVQKVFYMNKFVFGLIVFVVGGVVGFCWVYEWDEFVFMILIIGVIVDFGFFLIKGGGEFCLINEDGIKVSKKLLVFVFKK